MWSHINGSSLLCEWKNRTGEAIEGGKERDERSHDLFPKMAPVCVASFAVLEALIKAFESLPPAFCKNPSLPPRSLLLTPITIKWFWTLECQRFTGSGDLLDLRNVKKNNLCQIIFVFYLFQFTDKFQMTSLNIIFNLPFDLSRHRCGYGSPDPLSIKITPPRNYQGVTDKTLSDFYYLAAVSLILWLIQSNNIVYALNLMSHRILHFWFIS